MGETTENEAISRFVDGTSCAADYMLQLQNIDRYPKSSQYLLRAIKEASGSAHQLAHMQQNPVFLQIRDQLESMMRESGRLALLNHIGKKPPLVKGRSVFIHNSDLLRALAILGKKIATSKSMKRTDVLFMVDERERNAKMKLHMEQQNANTSTANNS